MIRRALFDLLLFVSPFVLYALYLRLAPKTEPNAPGRTHPWTLLFGTGLVLVVLSFLLLGFEEGQGERGIYVPPHVENGQVVPGHIEGNTGTQP
jgi:hypothetical protein